MLGVNYGMGASTETMAYAESILPPDCEWAAFGASRMAFPMLAQAYLLGGHCRIGMEDTVYIGKGEKTPSNAALVEKSVGIIRSLGGEVATVDEARAMLKLAPRAR